MVPHYVSMGSFFNIIEESPRFYEIFFSPHQLIERPTNQKFKVPGRY